jgi:hypothetical protein
MKIIADISKKNWLIKDDELQGTSINASIGFTKKGKLPVVFDNLFFGVSVFSENEKIFEVSRPQPNTSYYSTDQEFLEIFSIDNLYEGRKYSIHVWAENSGEKWEEVFEVTLPRSESPYPSWTYDKVHGTWIPPKIYPDDDKVYIWDEESLSWVDHSPSII